MSLKNLTEPTEPTQNSNQNKYIIIALALLLAISWGYVIYDKNKTGNIITQKDGQIVSVNSQKDSLQSLFTVATSRYDSLKTTDISKDSELVTKDNNITEKSNQIKAMLAKNNLDAHQLAELKNKINSFNKQVDGYQKQIDELKTQNAQLSTDKQTVTAQRDVVQKNLDSTNTVVKEKDNIIDIGSTLHASNFHVEGIDEKKNGKEKETTKAKKVNKLAVSFDLDENRIVKTGTKELYLVITAPDGKALSAQTQGSGTFTPRDSSEKIYSQKIVVNYVQGQRQTVSNSWKGTSFEVGAYKLEVYENGFKIGAGTVELRKGGLF